MASRRSRQTLGDTTQLLKQFNEANNKANEAAKAAKTYEIYAQKLQTEVEEHCEKILTAVIHDSYLQPLLAQIQGKACKLKAAYGGRKGTEEWTS